MAEHMTAEQLREQIRNVALYARTKRGEVADTEAAQFALTAIANSLDQLAARLSGMAAVPADHVVVPRDVALLVRRVFLPANPRNVRSMAPETLEAVNVFIACVYAEPPHG